MTKLLTIYFDGAFSAKFLTPPSGKTMDGSQKRFGLKMMARTTSITMQNFVRYHTCRYARENCKSPRKWVQSLCAPLRPLESEMKENFYHGILHHVL